MVFEKKKKGFTVFCHYQTARAPHNLQTTGHSFVCIFAHYPCTTVRLCHVLKEKKEKYPAHLSHILRAVSHLFYFKSHFSTGSTRSCYVLLRMLFYLFVNKGFSTFTGFNPFLRLLATKEMWACHEKFQAFLPMSPLASVCLFAHIWQIVCFRVLNLHINKPLSGRSLNPELLPPPSY